MCIYKETDHSDMSQFRYCELRTVGCIHEDICCSIEISGCMLNYKFIAFFFTINDLYH